MIHFIDIAHRHGRNAQFVADQIGKGCLEHAAIYRLGVGCRLPGRDIDQICARFLEGLGDQHGVIGSDSGLAHPVMRRDTDRHGFVHGPSRAHRGEDFEREAQAVVQTAAVFICPPVLHRRDESGKEIAVGCMEFDQVKPGGDGAPRGNHKLIPHPLHIGTRHRGGDLVRGRPGDV